MLEAAISNGFGIKRLKNLNTCSNLKKSFIIFLIVNTWCLKQGLSNDNPFSQFETVDTVPLNQLIDLTLLLTWSREILELFFINTFTWAAYFRPEISQDIFIVVAFRS
jgi:hypothetical protein